MSLASAERVNARATRTGILPWHGIVLVAACLGWLGGCVVTDKIEFEVPPNTPPSIVVTGPSATPPGVPIDRIIRVDLSASPPPVILAFDVRDPDVDQVLKYRVYVDWDNGRGFAPQGGDIPPTGSSVRSVTVTVPVSQFTDANDSGAGECHKIELLVSGGFKDPDRIPVEQGDIAQVVFWAEVIDDTHPNADLSTCPN